MKDEVHEQQNGGEQVGTEIYSNTTVPPAASRAAFSFSASSLDTLARISWGRDSTSFLAWFREDRGKKKKHILVTSYELVHCPESICKTGTEKNHRNFKRNKS